MSQTATESNDSGFSFIDHLTSYPAVSDSISAFKANPYGKRSIALSNTGYERFVSPFIPYAKGPYGYVQPIVRKADSVATRGLEKADDRFPIVKEDTEKIKATLFDFAYFPFRAANNGKDYVLDVYGSEYKSCGGDGYVAGGKAMITTGLVVTSDTLTWLSNFLGQKKDESKVYANEKSGQARSYAAKKSGQVSDYIDESSGAVKNYASVKAEQAKEFLYQKKGQAEEATEQAKQAAKEKTDQ